MSYETYEIPTVYNGESMTLYYDALQGYIWHDENYDVEPEFIMEELQDELQGRDIQRTAWLAPNGSSCTWGCEWLIVE